MTGKDFRAQKRMITFILVLMFGCVLHSVAVAESLKALTTVETITLLKKEMDGLSRQIALKKKEGADAGELKSLSQAYEARKKTVEELTRALREGKNRKDKGMPGHRLMNTGKIVKHWDPNYPGHEHKCAKCGKMYHQPGDNEPVDFYSGRCPHCGFINQVPGVTQGSGGTQPAQGSQQSSGQSAATSSSQQSQSSLNTSAPPVSKSLINLPCSFCKNTGKFNNQLCSVCEGDGFVIGIKNESAKCGKCNGTGNMDGSRCSACNGSGWHPAWPGLSAFSPDSLPEVQTSFGCGFCSGLGTVTVNRTKCPACNGYGYGLTPFAKPENCRLCKGEGIIDFKNMKQCPACKGLGVAHGISRPDTGEEFIWANGSSVECRGCKGRGYFCGNLCPKCGGDGYSWTNSPQIVDCPACRGTGGYLDFPCKKCNGYGIPSTYSGVKGLSFYPGSGYHVRCVVCNGQGYGVCQVCGGDGVLWTPVKDPRLCALCEGKGYVSYLGYSDCPACKGLRYANVRRAVSEK